MGFVAPNPRFNASLDQGHALQKLIMAAGLSIKPRLYANDSGGQYFHAETDTQDNSGLPAWVMLGEPLNKIAPGIDSTTAIYLQMWVAEKGNFYDVAQVLAFVDVGMPLNLALT